MIEKTNHILSATCPMPKVDFEIITLGHGSGGILTNKLLEAGVLSLFSNEFLDQRHDGAILINQPSKMAISTDSFVVSPIFFPGGNIGDLAVNGTINDVNMCGAKAKYLTLSLILEEGLAIKDLWEILLTIKQTADKAGVMVITGDTKVVEKGKGDQIFINTTGVGEIIEGTDIGLHRVKKGDKIIVSDQIANHGIAIMSVREGLEFESTVLSDTRNFNQLLPELLLEFQSDIHLVKDPTRGGLASVLNEVARDTQLGIELYEQEIQIDQEVEGACELLGLDPLYVANEGVFLAFVKAEIADKFLEKLHDLDPERKASIVGEVTEEHPKKVLLQSKIGGKRIVNMLLGEQLPRIC